jgi:hypothetical protein
MKTLRVTSGATGNIFTYKGTMDQIEAWIIDIWTKRHQGIIHEATKWEVVG